MDCRMVHPPWRQGRKERREEGTKGGRIYAGFKINILDLDIFAGCFENVPFLYRLFFTGYICLLGESIYSNSL